MKWQAMVHNVFRQDGYVAGSLMIPRADIDYLVLEHPTEENLKLSDETEHTRFPFCKGGLDKILVINTK